jgi:glutamine---fructose-6-phosphate transaminase (isomerizing)
VRIPAIMDKATSFFSVDDDQLLTLRADGVTATDLAGNPIELSPLIIDWDLETAQKSGYSDYMSKEIHEQPEAVRATLLDHLDKKGQITFDEMRLSDDALRAITKVTLVGCGSSYHTAMVAKYAIEAWVRISVEVCPDPRQSVHLL